MSNMSLKSDYTGTKSVVVLLLLIPLCFILTSKCLHVPTLKYNLLAVNIFVSDNDVSLIFDAIAFTIKGTSSGQILYKGTTGDGLYLIPPTIQQPNSVKLALQHQFSHQRLYGIRGLVTPLKQLYKQYILNFHRS